MNYSVALNTDINGVEHVSIGQTRGGNVEWITPITLWELDSSGLCMPPGTSTNPQMPRMVMGAGTNLIGKVGIDQTTPGANAVYQSGSAFTIKSAPVVGVKTVTSTAAEIFAGSSRLSGRYAMTVYNESSGIVYWGPSGVTTSTGYPLLPGDSVTFRFSPSIATVIYMIAPASAIIRVVEVA